MRRRRWRRLGTAGNVLRTQLHDKSMIILSFYGALLLGDLQLKIVSFSAIFCPLTSKLSYHLHIQFLALSTYTNALLK